MSRPAQPYLAGIPYLEFPAWNSLHEQELIVTRSFRSYSSVSEKPVSPDLPDDEVPHITLIRPAKGLEPGLYECLASSFHQAYPRGKLTIYLCASSKDDPAYPTLCRLVTDYPGFDAKVYVEAEDPHLNGTHGDPDNVGPNPKIRNVSRAYREAKGDVIWIVDCNVWIDKGVAGRMVDRLYGYQSNGTRTTPFKFVHQLPLVVDTVETIYFWRKRVYAGQLDESAVERRRNGTHHRMLALGLHI